MCLSREYIRKLLHLEGQHYIIGTEDRRDSKADNIDAELLTY